MKIYLEYEQIDSKHLLQVRKKHKINDKITKSSFEWNVN